MSKKLRLNFSYSFSGQIWRILAEAETGIIVAEIRDGNRRKTDFAAISQNKLLYDSVPLPENWWISAVALQQGILLLQTYPDSQTPVPKGILALDVRSANIIWQTPNLNFAGVNTAQSAVIAIELTDSGSVYQLIDLKTGKISRLVPDENLDETKINADSKIIFPRHYTSENKYFPVIVSFLNHRLGIKAEKAVDYAEYQHLLIISYYLYVHNTLSNFLVVIDRQTGILLHESIATQLSGTGLDTFCIMNNQLIFVREKKNYSVMNYKFSGFFYSIPLLSLPLFLAPSVGMAVGMPVDSIGVEKKGNKIFVLYKVEAGETLSSISRKYNTSVEAIRAENSLSSSGLKLGDVIKVPYTTKPFLAGKKVHTVGASQTLYSIARQYNVTLEDIKKWNNLSSNEISLGQQLVVGEEKNAVSGAQVNTTAKTETASEETASVQPATPSTNAAGKKVHVVEAQQGLFSIARSYNIPVEQLRKWNNLTSDNLKLGQELLLEEPEQAVAQASRPETVPTSPVKEPEKPKEKEQSRKERKQAEEKAAETQTEATEVEASREEPAEPVASTETRPSEKTTVKKDDKPESYTIANTSGYVKKVETGMAEVIESGSSDMFLALHRTAPVGTIMQVRNQMNDLSVFVKVIGKLPDTGANDKVIVKLSKKAYERLAALDKRFRVELSYMP